MFPIGKLTVEDPMSDSMVENLSHWPMVLVMESRLNLALPLPLPARDSQGGAAMSSFLVGSGILFLVAVHHGR